MNKNFKILSVLILIGLFFSLSSSVSILAKDKIKIKKNVETRASTETTGIVGSNSTLIIEEKDITDKVLKELEAKYNAIDDSTPEINKTH